VDIQFKNNAVGTLTSGIGAGDTTIVLTAGHGARFPSLAGSQYFRARLRKASGVYENIKATARTVDTLTVVRAEEGTSATTFSAGDEIRLTWTLASVTEATKQAVYDGVTATAGGTADALTATISDAPYTALFDRLKVTISLAAANATPTPTLNLTLVATATGAKTIVKGSNGALAPRDLPGADAVVDFMYDASLDKWVLLNPATGVARGKQTVWVPASSMMRRFTSGAAIGLVELSSNKIMRSSLDFHQSQNQYAQFHIGMPKGWDKGTLTYKAIWTSASGGAGDVVWGLRAVARGDDDPLDAAFGTAQEVTDTVLATNDVHQSPDSAALTVGGSPQPRDLVTFEVYRNAADAADTLGAFALLLGIELTVNYDAADDS